jgi:hypothetical protein
MAFVSNMQDDEQKNPAQGAVPPSGGAGVQLAPNGGIGNTGSPLTPGQPGGSPAGGGFATLDKYLSANQGQAEPLAGKITQGIGQQYNALDTQNNATIAGINNQVTNAPGYTASNPNTLVNEAANPVSFAGDQGNVKQFQSLLNNSYGGPLTAQGTTDYTKQQNAINNAIATGQQQTTTEAGRKQLLEQNEAAPSASVTGLNSAILSQDPNAQAKVENAYKPFSGLLTNLYSGAQDVNQKIAKEQADATSSSAAANKQIADQIASLNTNLTATSAQDTAAQNKYNQSLQDFQTQWSPINSNLNGFQDTLNKYGFTANPIVNPLSPLLKNQATNVVYTPQTVATQEQADKGQAFQTLLNGLNLGIPSPIATTAGTAAAPQTFNTPVNDQLANQIYLDTQNTINANPLRSYQDTLNWKNAVDPTYEQLLGLLQQQSPTPLRYKG